MSFWVGEALPKVLKNGYWKLLFLVLRFVFFSFFMIIAKTTLMFVPQLHHPS